MSSDHGSYIVVFKKDAPDHVLEQAVKDIESQGGKVGHRYDELMKGFSATIPDSHLTTLNSHDHVDYIEADGEVTTQAKSLGIK